MKEGQGDTTPQVAAGRPLRPALIASARTVTDYSMFIERLLVGLADQSVPVALVCPPGSDVSFMLSGAVEVIRHPAVGLPLMGRHNRRRLVERLERFRPSVLHCLCETQSELARQLSRQLDLPYLLTVNSLQQRRGRLSVSSAHCAKIIVPAESIAANIAEVHPKLADRIEQINIGTFVARTSRCFRVPSRLAGMVTAHRFDNADEFETLLGAIRNLMIGGYEFVLVVMGSGRGERRLRKLLAAFGLLQIVTIVPRLKPWRSVLAAGDIFIQPVASPAFNPLLLEAMSVGAAVAACKGGVDDLIMEDKTALVFDPDDELSITGRLQQFLDRHELARQIARGAQQYLRKNHTVSNMVSSFLQAYREAEQWYKR